MGIPTNNGYEKSSKTAQMGKRQGNGDNQAASLAAAALANANVGASSVIPENSSNSQ